MKAKLFPLIVLLLVLSLALTFLADRPVDTVLAQEEANGVLNVSLFYQGQWYIVGSLSYEKDLSTQLLDLARPFPDGSRVYLRITHAGTTAAHIDAALLDSIPPSGVYGSSEEPSLALRKLARRDYDLVHAQGRTLTLVYDLPANAARSFALTARIEPEVLSQTPFQFPLENLYKTMTPSSSFYTYRWDSQPGWLTPDGDINRELLGQPFFKEFCKSGSGHPNGYIYGWVFNDSQNMYVALDFVPDNTFDGDKDYAKVYVNSPGGLRVFTVSVPEQRWGKPGFVYTPRAAYQHKIYELAIPFSELGYEALETGTPLSLAFAAYGTVSPPNNYPGLLDPSFGVNGISTINFGGYEVGQDIAVQDNGKIVIAGYQATDFALARLTITGTLDTTFSVDGIQTTNFNSFSNDYGYGVAIQDNGKILVVGESSNDFAIARYTITGTLDKAFSGDGLQTTDFGLNDYGNDITIQEDGKIVVAGQSGNDFALARYYITGTLDTSFGSGGLVTTTFSLGSNDYGAAVDLQEDGKIVVVGQSANNFALARYTITGTLDSSFNSNGKQTTDFGSIDTANDLAVQSDGKIVVAGESGENFALARYDSDGNLDGSFDMDGKLTTNFGTDDVGQAVAIQEDGRIVVAGYSGNYMAAARFTTDGSLDPTFGTGGRANTLGIGLTSWGYGLALQRDGMILVAGNALPGGDFAVIRYLNPGLYIPLILR